ncbi:hypothetical protein GFL21_15230 [Rhizobium anhuiense]|uniref:hypothetical protein n=1 Tax=Rhizobium anhuiense TaxID=1184720 RepID=UPI001441F77E|nr:hypothetical protein [Rhizobium anhuiense]NKM55863.1 hypothetical protein [Rhizobium anhuiense]
MIGRTRQLAPVIAVHLVLLQANSVAAKEPFSDYTHSLIELVNVFKKLDEVTASRIAANERHLLAKAMLRLSAAFYQLRVDKSAFYSSVYQGFASWGGRVPPDMYQSVVILQKTERCLFKNFNDVGARLGALIDLDGQEFEATLSGELEQKSRSLASLIERLGMNPSTPDIDKLILADAKAAADAAENLYRKSAEFAHVLDPSVVPPEHPPRCHSE